MFLEFDGRLNGANKVFADKIHSSRLFTGNGSQHPLIDYRILWSLDIFPAGKNFQLNLLDSNGCTCSFSRVSGAWEQAEREPGENPGRARRCNRGRTLHHVTVLYLDGKTRQLGLIRKSEDLPEVKLGISLRTRVSQNDTRKNGHPRIIITIRGFFLVTPEINLSSWEVS
jgi:hypothetical protein